MNFQLRQGNNADIEQIVHLSLLAWEPIFDSWKQIMGTAIFGVIFPDWRATQRETVETFCQAREHRSLWVAEVEGVVVGFLVYELNHKDETGEVQLLAVHPHYQKQGIGTALNELALAKLKESGMKVAIVGTGGDPGHAPARKAYEKVGYIGLPAVHYYQYLE